MPADPDSAVLALIEAANEAGGKDNVSAILVETPEYEAISERAPAATRRVPCLAGPWFVAGVLTAAVLFGVLRPYLEQTASGMVVRFGTVRTAENLIVGPHGLRTISEAIERARAGDTISVSPGEYHETLHLRSGVSIISTELHGARIIAPGVAVAGREHSSRTLLGLRYRRAGRSGHADLEFRCRDRRRKNQRNARQWS